MYDLILKNRQIVNEDSIYHSDIAIKNERIALINNTIRLSVYSKRFLIRTMRLVGATNKFIQTPFLKKGIYYGMLAALFSIFLLTITIKIAFDSFG